MKCSSPQIHVCKKSAHFFIFIIQLNFTSESQSCKGVKFGPSWAQPLSPPTLPGFSQISHSEPQGVAFVCTEVSGSAHCQGPVVLRQINCSSLCDQKRLQVWNMTKTPRSSFRCCETCHSRCGLNQQHRHTWTAGSEPACQPDS